MNKPYLNNLGGTDLGCDIMTFLLELNILNRDFNISTLVVNPKKVKINTSYNFINP